MGRGYVCIVGVDPCVCPLNGDYVCDQKGTHMGVPLRLFCLYLKCQLTLKGEHMGSPLQSNVYYIYDKISTIKGDMLHQADI